MMKRLLLFFAALFLGQIANAAIVVAASCSNTDITTAMTTANAGDTVVIPAGNCTHTSQLNSNAPYTKGIKIQGAGVGRTNITLNYTTPFGSWLQWAPTSGTADLCCMSIGGTVEAGSNFIILNGSPTNFRFHHLDFGTGSTPRAIEIGFNNIDNRDVNLNITCTPILGLIDHINFVQNVNFPFIRYWGCSNSWQSGSQLGTSNRIFVEDSVFTQTTAPFPGNIVPIDGECAGNFTIRRNVISNMLQQTHDLSTLECRGTRSIENYDNTYVCTTAVACNNGTTLRGGTGVIFNNTVQLARYTVNFVDSENTRDGTAGGNPFDFLSGANTHGVCTSFRSMCGTSHTPCGQQSSDGGTCVAGVEGTGTCHKACTVDADCQNTQLPSEKCINIDQAGTNGYIARDQTGAGVDTGASHTQASDPYYLWSNVDSLNSNAIITSGVTIYAADQNLMQVNRDFYQQITGAGCTGTQTTGVCVGTLANRAANCTPVVAYRATDTNTLYKCLTTNTWTAYYTPAGRHSLSDPIPAPVGVAAL